MRNVESWETSNMFSSSAEILPDFFFEIAHASTKAHLQNGIDVTKRAEGAANSEHTAVGLHENEAQFAQRLRVKTEEKDCISALQSTNLFRCPLI